MAREKKKARLMRPQPAYYNDEGTLVQCESVGAAFKTVFSEELMRSKIDGGFTPKNFAVTKWMVELAAQGLLPIDGMVFRNINMTSYRKSRFVNAIRIRRIEWPERLDPSLCRTALFSVRDFSEPSEDELMMKILRDNVEHVQNLCVYLNLGLDCSEEAKEGGFVAQTASDFLATLAECVGLETLSVNQTWRVSTHATQDSLQVKVLEVVKELPKLTALQWNGNMTEDMWHPGKEGGAAVRCSLLDYFPAGLTDLLLNDGWEPRLLPWRDDNGLPAALKALMSNTDERASKLESLLLPTAFWALPAAEFESYIEHINAGNLQEIGFADDFKLTVGPVARDAIRHGYRCRNLPPPRPRLDLLVRSLTRPMCVDLGKCRDAEERGVRVAWVASLLTGEDEFYKCDREDENGVSHFSLWKKFSEADGRESQFEVLVRVG